MCFITILCGNNMNNVKIFYEHKGEKGNIPYEVYFTSISTVNNRNIITDKNEYRHGKYILEGLIISTDNTNEKYSEHFVAQFDFTIKDPLIKKPSKWFFNKKNILPVITLSGEIYSYQTKLTNSNFSVFIETDRKESDFPRHEFYKTCMYDDIKIKEEIFNMVYNYIIKYIKENKIK